MPETLQWMPLSQIRLHPRARKHDPVKLEELKESLKSRGQLMACRGRPKEGSIEIYNGSGRFQAAQELGWDKIMVIVEERSDDQMDLDIIHENLKREDLDPISEAEEYQHLMAAYQWSQAQVAERVGISQPSVNDSLSLLSLPNEIQEIIRHLIVSKSIGVIISKMSENEVKKAFADAVSKEGLSVSQAQDMLEIYKAGGAKVFMQNLGINLSEEESKDDVSPESSRKKKRKTKSAKISSNLWPGLPAGAQFKSQGGRHFLSWPSARYSKSMIQAILNTAPEAIEMKKKKSPVREETMELAAPSPRSSPALGEGGS